MEHFIEASPGPQVEPGDRLRDYERLKLDLASILQDVLHLADEKSDPDGHQKCRDLLASLAEDRFTLAVMGRFNRGKSSLMNALLGMDRLPVGIVPLTSVITKVSYGNPEKVLIEYAGSSLKSDIPLDRLGEYVTEMGNPGNSKRIAAAEVQLPAEFLRRGLYFVDTPGVGSAMAANTATTESFLPDADAVILVTSFDSPLDSEEIQFLHKIRQHVRKVFFVVNKLDLFTPEQRRQVLDFMRGLLDRELGIKEPTLFPISARLGLEAKLTSSVEKLSESGLSTLEENLITFLTTQKTEEFLARTCDRALSLLWNLPPTAMKPERLPLLEDFKKRLTGIRSELVGNAPSGRLRDSSRIPSVSSPSDAQLPNAALRPCEVCRAVTDAMFKFMAKFQYDIYVDGNERASLVHEGGLCSLHTWQYAEIASPQGISVSYPDLLFAISRRLAEPDAENASGQLGSRTKALIPSPGKCRACRERLSVERKVIAKLLENLPVRVSQGANKYPVLCLPHLSALLQKVSDPELARSLVEFRARLFERLAENMQRYGMKFDARRRYLHSDDEEVAYRRALSHLVGERALCTPWHVEYLI
ncbi:MAG TPA: dynamin family protein [Candidatus Sulfotelmatobacter sp.]|nr:dynamin family protein [Candidatus Sulfotelmatobacter sp.]